MSENKLIVPISAQALVVTEDNKISNLNLGSRFNKNSVLGKDQQLDLDALFEKNDGTSFRKRGIHLHWKLPKGLKHGISNNNGDIEFPAVPNRWMIVRYQNNIYDPKKIPSKTWIVKSDAINDEKEEKNWVVLNEIYKEAKAASNDTTVRQQQYEFKSIGKSQLWNNDFTEENIESVALTAVGAANPYFSVIYDDCNDVFGFCDTMEGINLGNGTFSYVITGWYSNPKNDPFAPSSTLKPDLIEKIKKQWLEENKIKDVVGTIFSCSIHTVKWNKDVTSGLPTSSINISLGNTTTEAFSALLSKDKIDTNLEVEEYINALQNHLLEDEHQAPSLQKLKIENHKKQFTPKQNGILWEIKKIEQNNGVNKEDTKPNFPNDTVLVANLKKLNGFQLDCNETRAKLASLQQEYYFVWYKIVLTKTRADIIFNIDNIKKALENDLEEKKNEIVGLKQNIKVIEDNITSQINEIAKNTIISIPRTTESKNTSAEYELVQRADDSYWQPNDPAILFYGDGIGEVQSFYQDITDKIICRLSSTINDKLVINEIPQESEAIFNVVDLNIESSNIPSEIIKKLVYEALLLDPKLAAFTAITAQGNGNGKSSKVITDYVANNITPAQTKVKETIESFAIQTHKQAWEPLFMLWEASFTPKNSNTEITCNGLTPITNSVSQNFKELVPESTAIKHQNVLAQNLSGFNKQLLAQLPCLQLPPISYEKIKRLKTDLIIDKNVLDIIGSQSNAYGVACKPSQTVFSPLREGNLTLIKVSLIDAFGQEKIIITDKVTPSEILIAKHFSAASYKINIPLASRIIQPTKLQFNWVNANNEILYQDTGKLDHPILGWLVPNYLDKMVMIYDQHGKEVKALRLIGDKKTEEFYPTNDGILNEEKLKKAREQNLSPALKQIIDSLDISTFLIDTKALKIELSKSNVPQDNSFVSLLYGKPIAIAQGEISLKLLGNATKNPLWSAAASVEDMGNIEQHKISIQIGNKEMGDDGLLGYYLGDHFSTLIKKTTDEKIEIRMNDKAQKITVLHTAGTGFYLNAGNCLPTQNITLFPHAVEELTKEISISFMLSPFIEDKENPTIPTPNTNDVDWNWVHKTEVQVWSPPKPIKDQKKEQSFDFATQQLYEGWIKIDNIKLKNK